MKFVIHPDAGTEPDLVDAGPFRWRITPRYGQMELRAQNDLYATLYYMPFDATSALICASLTDAYDGLAKGLIDANSAIRAGILTTVKRQWPIFWRLANNGAWDRYSDCALMRLTDPDDATPRWFVGSVLGNIDVENLDVLHTPRAQAIIQLVAQTSYELVGERLAKDLDSPRFYADVFVAGLKQDAAVVAALTLDNLGSIIGLFSDDGA